MIREVICLPRFRIKLPLEIQTEAEAVAWMETDECRRLQVHGLEKSVKRYLYQLRLAREQANPRPRRTPRKRRL